MSEIQQNTEAWFNARAGFITGSRISAIFPGSDKLTSEKYLTKLAVERLTGVSLKGGFTSDRLEQGLLLEPEARDYYSMLNDVDVTETGFISHPIIPWFGTSPDGLVGDDGLLELKNRDVHIHIPLFRTRKPPRDALLQMYAQMSVSDRQWCDYGSYNNVLPPKLRFVVVRVWRKDAEIEVLENQVIKFSQQVDELTEELRNI